MPARSTSTRVHGNRLRLTDRGHLIGTDFRGSLIGNQGADYRNIPAPAYDQVLYDDFLGPVISGVLWAHPTKGSDGGTVDFAKLAGVGGQVRGTTGAGAGANMATNGIQIDSALDWKANSSGLAFEASIKPSALTTICIYAGFTDKTTLEAPFTLSAGVLTSNASNAAGFLFDTLATAATLKLVGVATDVDATMQDTGVAGLSTSAFVKLRVEIDISGIATFYVNGTQVGTAMAAAVTPTVALTPVIAAFTRAAGSANIDLDYLYTASDHP